jgi:hypothetical protein
LAGLISFLSDCVTFMCLLCHLQNHFLFTLSTWNPIHYNVHKIGKALQSKNVTCPANLRGLDKSKHSMKEWRKSVLKTFSAQIYSIFSFHYMFLVKSVNLLYSVSCSLPMPRKYISSPGQKALTLKRWSGQLFINFWSNSDLVLHVPSKRTDRNKFSNRILWDRHLVFLPLYYPQNM